MGMLVLVLEGLAPVLVLVLVKQGQALELAVKLLVSSLVLMLKRLLVRPPLNLSPGRQWWDVILCYWLVSFGLLQ